MSFDAIIVIAVLVFLMISLYKEIVGPAMTFIIAVIILGITHVLDPSEILDGFANEQIAVIVMLLLLGDIYRRTSVLDIFFDYIFKRSKSVKNFTGFSGTYKNFPDFNNIIFFSFFLFYKKRRGDS